MMAMGDREAGDLVLSFYVFQRTALVARFVVAVRAAEIQNLPSSSAMRDSQGVRQCQGPQASQEGRGSRAGRAKTAGRTMGSAPSRGPS
jgi:hypothetical protein